jgi:hypothetical protein
VGSQVSTEGKERKESQRVRAMHVREAPMAIAAFEDGRGCEPRIVGSL